MHFFIFASVNIYRALLYIVLETWAGAKRTWLSSSQSKRNSGQLITHLNL